MAAHEVSAMISEGVSESLERYVRATGINKDFLIEAALAHHLEALREIPTDSIIPPRIVVTQASLDRVAALLERAPVPTPSMRNLTSGR